MVMRIEKSSNSEFVIYALSGRIEKEIIGELKKILASEVNQRIVFDLQDLKLVDQSSVEFLEKCEARGMLLWNCPVYLREWIARIRTANSSER
jgi:hypothetical protein